MKPVFKSSLLAGLGFAGAVCAGPVAMAADLPSTAAPPPIAPVPFFLFQDTSIGYKLDTAGTDPGSHARFVKNSIDVTHVDAWLYGTNFINFEYHKSASLDPSAPLLQSINPPYITYGDQAAETYFVYRGTLSGNAMTHSKMFSFYGVKDISLEAGGDVENENNAFAANKMAVVAGLQIAFDVPGFFTLGVNMYHEWNHNGLSQFGGPLNTPLNGPTVNTSNANYSALSGQLNYKTTADFELAYMQPLNFIGGYPLRFSGFTNVVLPKGLNPGNQFNGGLPSNTRTEILSENRITLDVGKLIWARPNLVDVFVGYKYWWNKFGSNSTYSTAPGNSYLAGDDEHEVIAGFNWHL